MFLLHFSVFCLVRGGVTDFVQKILRPHHPKLPLETKARETETGLSVLEDCLSGSPCVGPSGSSKTKQKNKARARKRWGMTCLLSTCMILVFNSHSLVEAGDSNSKRKKTHDITQEIDEEETSYERSLQEPLLDLAHLVCPSGFLINKCLSCCNITISINFSSW